MVKYECTKCKETFDWFYKLVEHVTQTHSEVTQIERAERTDR